MTWGLPLVLSCSNCSFSGGAHDDDEAGQSYKAVAAGGIIVCICNYIFLAVFGSEEAYESNGEPVVSVQHE